MGMGGRGEFLWLLQQWKCLGLWRKKKRVAVCFNYCVMIVWKFLYFYKGRVVDILCENTMPYYSYDDGN